MDNYRDAYKAPEQVVKYLDQKKDLKQKVKPEGPHGHLNCHMPGCKAVGRFSDSTYNQTWRCAFHHFGHT